MKIVYKSICSHDKVVHIIFFVFSASLTKFESYSTW